MNVAAKSNFMIYGAYGYTGTLVAEEARRRGHRPILAGRSEAKLQPVAERLGLPHVALDLADGAALRRALESVALVFHAAGPFIDTSDAMIRACLDTRTHYVDVTGEIPVFQNTFRHDAAARAQGVLLLSGAGFDVVPTDCLSLHVAQQLPSATQLEIGIAGMSQISPGTLKSTVDGAVKGGLVRRHGVLVSQPMGKGARTLRFADKSRRALPIPWGDLETAFHTTSIPNITTYMAYPGKLVDAAAATWPLAALATPLLRPLLSQQRVRDAIGRAISERVQGPDEAARNRGRTQIYVRASDDSGRSAEAWLETLEGYAFTAVSGVRVVEHTLERRLCGALTPALAFGKDFVLEVEGTRRLDAL